VPLARGCPPVKPACARTGKAPILLAIDIDTSIKLEINLQAYRYEAYTYYGRPAAANAVGPTDILPISITIR